MRRRGGIGRGVEIVAERGAERRLVAARDVDRVDRPAATGSLGVGAEQLGERARFRFEPLRGAFGFGERPARPRLGLARLRMRRLGGEGVRFRVARAPAPSVSTASRFGAQRRVVAAGALQARALALDRRAFALEPREPARSPRRGRRRARCGAR